MRSNHCSCRLTPGVIILHHLHEFWINLIIHLLSVLAQRLQKRSTTASMIASLLSLLSHRSDCTPSDPPQYAASELPDVAPATLASCLRCSEICSRWPSAPTSPSHSEQVSEHPPGQARSAGRSGSSSSSSLIFPWSSILSARQNSPARGSDPLIVVHRGCAARSRSPAQAAHAPQGRSPLQACVRLPTV